MTVDIVGGGSDLPEATSLAVRLNFNCRSGSGSSVIGVARRGRHSHMLLVLLSPSLHALTARG